MSDEKEVDEKLYRVVRKKGSHVNTKVNPDGTKAALQFTDGNNDLNGPLELIEVDEVEYIRAEELQIDIDDEMAPRTWKQVVVEDIVVPVAREAIEQFLNIGFQYLEIWMNEKVVPAARQKAKNVGRDISVFLSAMKPAIKGEQPKALQIIEAERHYEKAHNSVKVAGSMDSTQAEQETTDKIEITQSEFEQIVALTKRSAVTLVGCINLLKNSAISDMDEKQRIEFENQIKELTTEDLMKEINLLLQDKNKGILDATSYAILSAFRDGEFIVDGERVSIGKYIGK
ncbi:MAG: hypothetical protein J6L77_00300 [Coprococcus sp.]|nr:hypothetical protein [Coprococcus sp.]